MIYQLSEQEWPILRRWKATGKARGKYFGELCRTVYQKWGEEGLKVIGKVYEEAAIRTFEKGLKGFGIEGNNATTFARFFVISNTIIGYNMELFESAPERAVVRYHTCHLFDNPQKGDDKICGAAFNFEKTAARILNPRLSVIMTRLQTAGDPYCEFVVEMK